MAELTPMMKQYFEIKNKCRDYIVFYRLGDFYEMFFEDAKIASQELELTLTGRDYGQPERAPMCGVPYHSYETYVGKLVRKGYKVAICEQVEDPKSSKGLVKREIVRMITPGTLIEASMLDENRNNFLGCVFGGVSSCGICFCDISTGEVFVTEARIDDEYQELFSEFGRFLPREVLLGGNCVSDEALLEFIAKRLEGIHSVLPELLFDAEHARERICQQFHMENLEAAGLEELPAALCSLGGLLAYLEDTQKSSLGSLNTLNVYQQGQYMELDLTARRNLELCETMRSKEKRGSLLWVIDKTKTAMGARLIRQWLERPLLNPIHIRKRQDAVQVLANDVINRDAIIEELKQVFDIERLIGRVVYGSANCRDLCSLQSAMVHLPAIYQYTESLTPPLLQELHRRIDTLTDIALLIEAAIQPDPPQNVREGGFIRDGFSKDVDYLRDLASGGKGEIAAIEQRERERTGIKNLKIGYNRVFGYYIEVSKSNIGLVPEDYIRKQTLANCERYIMQELKDLENTVLGAQERLISVEYELFCQLREQIAAQVHRIQRTAQALANLDVLCSLAQVACENNYVCPDVDFSGCIDIKDGRHPVVEKVLDGSFFVPNDTLIDNKDNRVAIITGPNMAGKSTYMRQVALITIMAQMGSFVPAASAHIGIADRVFTRVGASDDLASGQSTFMVEMNEVADILRYATRNSLLVLDEIGRGTSTYDGMSIARAVIEYVADKRKLGARALFATHYHELTALEDLVEGIENYNIAVKKRGDEITFLRKIIRGGADDSYGIEVAKLAGIPNPVIRRAKNILADLERYAPKIHLHEVAEDEEPQITMSDLNEDSIAQRLREMQIETMTPIEAMNALFELKKWFDSEGRKNIMAVIQELSPHLADLIAAGEVVERPASAAKELVENAIDAGATRIQVEIENGGITYLRIMDNGCGMSAEDAPVAFKRHATSKLRTESDLAAIGTLGFRGEALAAIAAVSRIDLFTKQKNMLAGQHLRLEAGELQVHEDAGCPDGTTIIIRDLFFNTPARMKFLKKDFTEAGYVVGVVQHAALSHPEIAFTMVRDGKQVFSSAGDGKLLTPVFSVFGRDFTANMIEAERFERESVSAWGYITKPHYCRPNRSMQHFFVNGRYVKSKLLQAALEEAYRNKIITGKYPSCALFLTLPLNMVDVNVHPAKTEVKFAHEQNIFQTVYITCKNALDQNDNIPVIKLEESKKTAPKEDNITQAQQRFLESPPVRTSDELPQEMPRARPASPEQVFLPKKAVLPPQFKPPIIDCDDIAEEPLTLSSLDPMMQEGFPHLPKLKNIPMPVKNTPPPAVSSPIQPPKPTAKVIGEMFCTYIIAEDEDGLLLLDKHAAHERILFNQLCKTTEIPQQQLLTPYIAEMNASESAILKEQSSLIQSIGFMIEPFGECSFAVRAVPAYLDAADISDVLSEIAEKLSANRVPTPDRLNDLIHTVACKAAVKAGKHTSQTELQSLCDRVLGDPEISCCPHGRPVTVRLTKYEIDKRFKRVNQ